ncbi:MAG: hypothetical protein IPK60_08135 [Sandaracinaceae bacterium]|nr:hypothetical protein [Sandaracinaceae bacterium]
MNEKQRRGFTIFGVPIHVQPMFLVIVLILNTSVLSRPDALLAWVLVVFTGVLAHEFGHALAILAFGHKPTITLHGFGGVTAWQQDAAKPVGSGARILISLAGPFTGIAIACIVALGAMVGGMHPMHLLDAALGASDARAPLRELVIGYILFVNGGWGVLNLLPIFPLDGGQVFASFADLIAPGRGRGVALVVSMLLAATLAILSLRIQSYWTAMVTVMLALQSWTAFRSELVRMRDRVALPMLEQARTLLAQRALPQARELALRAQAEAKTDVVRLAATEIVAWSFTFEKNYADAAHVLSGISETQEIDPILEGIVMVHSGQFEAGIARLEEAMQAKPNAGLGVTIIRAHVDANNWNEVLAFVSTANLQVFAAAQLVPLVQEARAAGQYEIAGKLGETIFARFADPGLAYDTARSFAKAGDPQKALVWLGKARDAGFADRHSLDQDEDLESVRRSDGWFDFRATVPFTRPAS